MCDVHIAPLRGWCSVLIGVLLIFPGGFSAVFFFLGCVKIRIRYFERRTPLADTAMLLEVVAEVGLDMEAARAHLDSGRGYDAVRDGVASARAGTQSIPVFVRHHDSDMT